jgi:transcriptional regulator with XRE-family HTH domain
MLYNKVIVFIKRENTMNKIKELRVMSEKSQAAVAGAIGLTQQAYQRYEIEGVSPSAEILVKLADYHGVTVDYLLKRSDKVEEKDIIRDREFAIIHKHYNQMDEKGKDKLKKILALAFDIAFEGG